MRVRLVISFLLAQLLPVSVSVAGNLSQQLEQLLSSRSVVVAAGHRLGMPAEVRRFYARNDHYPVWIVDGDVRPAAGKLLEAIREAEADGLRAADYHLGALLWMMAPARPPDPDGRAVLELLLTDAFITLAEHSGRGRPVELVDDWLIPRPELDAPALLDKALENGTVREVLRGLLPNAPEYRALREARARLLAVTRQGDWPAVPEGRSLRPGMVDGRIHALRQRLRASGDHQAAADASLRYDADLEAAVRRFQSRHGLEPDAVVGAETLAAMNRGAATRLRQVELNLERWRRLPRDFGQRHVRVNIPGYSLEVVEQGQVVMRQRVIVGRGHRRTPIMTGRLRTLVLNPSWTVPRNIVVEDLLPRLQANPDLLRRYGFEVLQGWKTEKTVDPAGIDWHSLSADYFPYRLRQAPGPANALGRVKFVFPNRHAIFLHDTPQRGLFSRDQRALSSGCVRVERPLELAVYLLKGSGIGHAGLKGVLDSRRDYTLSLPRPVPVHLLYWTAWIDDEGELQFRDDVYGHDLRLMTALQRDEEDVAADRLAQPAG